MQGTSETQQNVYGGVGSVIVMFLWLCILNLSMLFGAHTQGAPGP